MYDGTNEWRFYYDANDEPIGFIRGGSTYNYVKNLQGDIVKILDNYCNEIVTYTYDSWGNLIAQGGSATYTTLGRQNPLRYRGYFYDTDTGLYYLQSRYYNPEWGRFVNGDEPIADDLNLYAYCGNDWIDWIDSDGCSSYSFIKYSYYKTTWSKEKLKIERNYFVIPLTYYMETEHGGTLTWTQDKSFSVSISADLGISVKVLSAKLGLQFSWTLDHSSSYSYSLDRKKGKYAIIVARIDAQVYKVIKTVYTRKEYYKSGFLSFTYRAKSEMISDQNSAKMYVPIKSSTSIKLVYSNRKTYK